MCWQEGYYCEDEGEVENETLDEHHYMITAKFIGWATISAKYCCKRKNTTVPVLKTLRYNRPPCTPGSYIYTKLSRHTQILITMCLEVPYYAVACKGAKNIE